MRRFILFIAILSSNITFGQDITSGLVGYWPFNGNANDYSGKGNNGQLSGSASFDVGYRDGCINFKGFYNPGHVKVSNSQSLIFSDYRFTFNMWVKLNSYGGCDFNGLYSINHGFHCLYAKSHDRRGIISGILYDSNQIMNIFENNINLVNGKFSVSPYIINNYELNTWFNYCVTSDGQIIKIYANAIKVFEQTCDINLAVANTQDLYFGKYSDYWYPLNGSIDEVRIYNRALSDCDIKALYYYPEKIDPDIKTVDSLNFQSTFCDNKYLDTFWVKNKGINNLIIDSSYFTGINASDFLIISPMILPDTVQSNDSVEFIIKFNPTSPGTKTAILSIGNNSCNNPYNIILSAHSGFPIMQSTDQIIFSYLICLSSIEDTFMVYNTGTDTLNISSIKLEGLDASEFSILKPDKLPLYIIPNDSMQFVICFKPNNKTGTDLAFLNIENNACKNPYIINLTAKNDSISFVLDNSDSDTIIIDLGKFCPGSGSIDTTITIFNKSSIGTTFKIENNDPHLKITPERKAVKKEGEPKKSE